MKELSIEQKAKAYDEALKVANKYKDIHIMFSSIQDEIFPVLAESEDERIRTFLHHTFTAQYLCKDKLGKWHGEPVVNILAWLEKKYEQKPILDVEIPFGAKDSELEEVSYDIPKGYHAEIEDNKVVIKKGEKKFSWSEEDEIMHKTIILNLKVQMENCAVPSKDSLNKVIGWFQKLKHQRTFVPSEEEMKALEFCLEHNIDKDGVFGSKVVKLYKKLKKLTK